MTAPTPNRERILIIKLSALGDVVQALGPMSAIRRHHADADLILLTTKPYVSFLESTGWFSEIWVDERPRWSNPVGLLRLRGRLRGGQFNRVYDLQTSDRSNAYFRMFPSAARPEWSGIARGCSHPHRNPDRDAMHTVDRQREQLNDAGIADVPPPSLDWVTTDTSRFRLKDRYVLMAPGGSAHRPEKRWPAGHYAVLANTLANKGYQPVLIGTASEADEIARIHAVAPAAANLMGATSILEMAALARHAAGAVGNDSGPMHLIACAGAPTVVLFSAASDPALCGQRGPSVRIVRRNPLSELGPAEVADALEEQMAGDMAP